MFSSNFYLFICGYFNPRANFDRYVMEVIVTDTQGTLGSQVTATVTVSIADMNNHRPVFATNYAEDVAENSAKG